MDIDKLAELLGGYYGHSRESYLQAYIQGLLHQTNHARERRLGEFGVIDFLTDNGIGVECKTSGSPSGVLAQLLRYTKSPDVAGLILLSTKRSSASLVIGKTELGGKPFRCVCLSFGGL